MSEEKKAEVLPVKERRKRLALLAVAAALAAVGFWVLHPAMLAALLRWGLPKLGNLAGVELRMGRVEAALGRPWIFRDVVILPAGASPTRSGARLAEAVVRWSAPAGMFGRGARLFSKAELRGVEVVWERLPGPPPAAQSHATGAGHRILPPLPYPFVAPRELEIKGLNLEAVSPEGWLWVEGVDALLREGGEGFVRAAGIQAGWGERSLRLPEQRAAALWQNGALFLTGAEIREGLRLEGLWVQAAPGGASFEASADVFGGMLRGGGRLGRWQGEAGLDAAFWAAGINVTDLAGFLGIEGETSGRIEEARLTFRGHPAKWQEAEASLRLDARDMRRNRRAWDRLEISATLVNRRLTIPELELEQGANRLSLSGDVALSGGWAEMASSPMRLNLSAKIEDLSALGLLAGAGPHNLKGRMTISARLAGRMPRPEGFISVEASKLEVRGLRWDSARLEALLRNGEAHIELFELSRGKDVVTGHGVAGLSPPHEYSGQLTARLSNFGDLLASPGAKGGRLDLRWQGDGRLGAHSGAFQAGVDGLRTPWTPAGLSGRFSGTYSPESLYLGGFELEHGRTRLSLRATLGAAGIQAGGIELRGPRGRLGGGEFYLPINALKLLETGSLAASVIADKTLHLRIETSGPVALETLFGLAGRDAPAEGLLSAHIEAGGPPGGIEGHGKASIQNLRSGGSGLQPSALALEAKVGSGRLAIEGELRTGRVLASRVTGDWPLRLGGGEQGGDSPGDPGDFHVAAQVPGLELSLLRPLFPGLTKLRGRLHGTLEGGATNGAPSWHGRLSWRDAGLETGGPAAFEISGLSGELIAQGSEITLESCSGFVDSGPFRLDGRLSLDGWPHWQAQGDFEARGARLRLPAVDDLRADVDLRFEGGPGQGLASGEVRLVEGRLSKRIEIVPQLAPGWGEGAPSFQAPDFSKFLLPGLEDWALDVRVRSAKPGSLSGGPSGGEIEPSLRLAGSLAKPVPEGVIEASNLRAFLPFTTLHIPRARAEFFLEDPWMPHLDAQGIAEVMDYDVDLRAQGRLADRMLYIRSEPPLPRESLLLLLTTGYIAGDLSSQSFAGAIARQPGAGALQQLAKQLGLRGWEAGSLTSLAAALQPSPMLPAGQQPLRARLRLRQGSGAEARQDELGAWNIQAGYRYRFR